MREILFRGKRVDNSEWVQGYLFKSWDRAFILWGVTGNNPNMVEVIPETVGQFTGLTDENGNKIFEGDIIRYADDYYYNCYLKSIDNPEEYDDVDMGNIWTVDKVVYGTDIGYPAFDLNKNDFEENGLCVLKESFQYFYEVVGNIHDNPELLGEQK